MSSPVAQAVPATARPMPSQPARVGRRPCAAAIRPCQTGWVATSAVAVATEPSCTLGIQVAKCRASATPARTAKVPLGPRNVRSSVRRGPAVIGVSAANARPLRQNATASAGAAANAMSGAEVETASTATVNAAAVSQGGRSRGERIFIPRRRLHR
jgi:hypothetical protein